MSVCVAVTDSAEGQAALAAAGREAAVLGVGLVVVDLTGEGVHRSDLMTDAPHEVVRPTVAAPGADEIDQVLQVLEERPEVTRLVVGVRRRSAIGKAVLGSIAQRLILESPVPVLSVSVGRTG